MTLARPVSRFVALALLFALCWNFTRLIVIPLVRLAVQEREEATNSWSLLSRYRLLEADLPELQRQLEKLKTRSSGKAFLQGKSTAMMAAEMQGAAQRFTSLAGVTLRSTRTLPLAIEDGFNRFGVELDITASIVALTTLLHSITAAEPMIFVERLLIQVPENGAGAKSADGQSLLSVNIRLNAYGRISASETESP